MLYNLLTLVSSLKIWSINNDLIYKFGFFPHGKHGWLKKQKSHKYEIFLLFFLI